MLRLFKFNVIFNNNTIQFIIYATIICLFFWGGLTGGHCLYKRTDSDTENQCMTSNTHYDVVDKTCMKISTYIITSITPRSILLVAILAILYVSIYMTVVILYISWDPVLLDQETRVLHENHRRIMHTSKCPVRLVCVHIITMILPSAQRHLLTRFHLLQYQNCK